MSDKACVLIQMLRDALHRVEEDSKACPDDPAVAELKAAMHLGIAELESARAQFQRSPAA